jgi:hypothetical protein
MAWYTHVMKAAVFQNAITWVTHPALALKHDDQPVQIFHLDLT